MMRYVVFTLAFMFVFAGAGFAQDTEVQDLKRRVEELEKRVADGKEVTEELGHRRLHPVHSVYGLTVSGSVTATAHGAAVEGGSGPSGEGAFSADLVVETPVGEKGRAVLVFDFQRGAGMDFGTSGIGFATNPNGAGTGYNADIEAFNDSNVHLTQAYYERDVNERLSFSVGQLDITGYFDANEFANDERSQFMAPVFVNNPVIEFGGSEDFYALGVRATCAPTENIVVTLGAFEGDGDYTDTFDKPFLMAEADFAFKPFGMDGNYRVYYWYRGARPDLDTSDLTLAETVATPTNLALLEDFNNGVGISIDQMVSENIGVWLRAGLQREQVAQFDKFVGAGVNVAGEFFGRANDRMGFGYGASFMGQDYEDYLNTLGAFESAPEHYLELYYNYAVEHAGPDEGFHVSPDFQYVVNPGGDKNAPSAFIYGVRLQTYF
jgi:carbohydrate-selective porin OprB